MKPKSVGKRIKRLENQYHKHDGNEKIQKRIEQKIKDLKNNDK